MRALLPPARSHYCPAINGLLLVLAGICCGCGPQIPYPEGRFVHEVRLSEDFAYNITLTFGPGDSIVRVNEMTGQSLENEGEVYFKNIVEIFDDGRRYTYIWDDGNLLLMHNGERSLPRPVRFVPAEAAAAAAGPGED